MADINFCYGVFRCEKKTCIEQDRCFGKIAFQGHWKIRTPKNEKKKPRKSFPRCEVVYPGRCAQNMHNCNKPEVCSILGQCILLHPKIKGNKIHENYLRKELPLKSVIKYITKTMPSLKRIGQRRYYKPEIEFDN